MTAIIPELIAKGNFDSSIIIARKTAEKFKSNEGKANKYKRMQAMLESTKKKLDNAIEKTKSIMLSSGKSFYEEYVQADESSVTLAWLGTKLGEKSSEITSGSPSEIDVTAESFVGHYDFIDRTKKVGSDLLNGKGISNGLVKTCIGVGVAELLTQGITSYLTKQGIMSASLDLIGLGKLGIANIPTAIAGLKAGIGALWGVSMVGLVAGGVFVALKTIPAIKHLVDKAKANHKDNHALEDNIENMIKGQTVLS